MAPSRAKLNVAKILKCNPAGRNAIKEYDETGTLKESTRRIVVNVIVAAMCDTATGRIIHRQTKEFHAQGIVEMFPSLKDSLSKKGYEHFFDINSNTGFIQWRLKTADQHPHECNHPPLSNQEMKVLQQCHYFNTQQTEI
uniref:LAGLIDADG homing endonuclease n=1 Tax=Knipowitschia caucasica TaxID=637954 RepID=A0AAV2JMH9_KNICA